MVKIFTPNKAGKIEFTKTELENLLNEVWLDGYNANKYYWNSPQWISASGISGSGTGTPYISKDYVTTCNTDGGVTTKTVTVKLGDS